MTESTSKIKLDPSEMVGISGDNRTVGCEKSGTIGKVHLDASVTIGHSMDGRAIGHAKRSIVPK